MQAWRLLATGASCHAGKIFRKGESVHRDWKHEVSEQWLMSRKACLTASDIRKLIPDYKRIKAGKIKLAEAMQFAKVYGEKRSQDMDPMSFGAMARGHVLEPHAIDEFNSTHAKSFEYRWWDDRLIMDDALGFSPDALDIPQLPGTRFKSDAAAAEIVGKDGSHKAPEHVLEIKCYEAGTHFQRLAQLSSGEKLEERWQVATAMVVCPSIYIADIMFYAPQCRSWFYVEYDSHGLHDEIEVVTEIKEMWIEFKSGMDSKEKAIALLTSKTETEIYNDYMMDTVV